MTEQQVGPDGPPEYADSDDAVARTAGSPDATRPAGLGSRFGALLVDWIMCLLVSGAFVNVRQVQWAPLVVLVFEYGFFIGLFGNTPGMWLARIRCVSAADGGPLGVPRAVLRALLLCLVVPALIMDERRRGLHDRAAGSIVVGR